MNQGFPTKIQCKADLDNILLFAAKEGASDIFFIARDSVVMMCHKRNLRQHSRRLKDSEISNVLLISHSNEGEAILKGGVPLDYSYDLWNGEDRYRFRVNAVSTRQQGQRTVRITFRTIDHTPPNHEKLGIEKEILEVCKSTTQGLITFSGATGQGKSSSLAAILRDRLEDPDVDENIVTAESPIEYVYDAVVRGSSIFTQLEIGKDVSNWNVAIENMLRMHPTSILVGESRDRDTMSSSISAALTGHSTYTTLHANDNASTAQRIVNMFPFEQQNQIKTDFFQAARLMVSQRLLRTVDGKLTAIREILVIDDQVRDYIISSSDPAKATFLATEKWGQSVISNLVSKFEQGILCPEEHRQAMSNYKRLQELNR